MSRFLGFDQLVPGLSPLGTADLKRPADAPGPPGRLPGGAIFGPWTHGAIGLFIALALSLLAAPLAADAQPAGKVPRIGVLWAESPEATPLVDALRQGLRDLGYVEGQNIAIEWRSAYGRAERLADLAAELVRLKVDVIVAPSNTHALAAQRATKTLPIVTVLVTDPVGLGLVASLARPGGNITGLTTQSADIAGKRLQLLMEAVPKVSRAAFLWDSAFSGGRHMAREAELAASALGVQLQLLEAGSPTDLDRAFAAMIREGAGAALVQGSPWFLTQRAQITALAIKSRLPAICVAREYAEAGCLLSYGASFGGLFRRAATYVDKILKGARPADLPVEQPTRFELVINMKTAKALGLTMPRSVLIRADQLIE